ncbi:MAG: hypothetical protein AB8U25_02925 [Rickettsiales endosymbiont of Dermacentor nuttalli]
MRSPDFPGTPGVGESRSANNKIVSSHIAIFLESKDVYNLALSL